MVQNLSLWKLSPIMMSWYIAPQLRTCPNDIKRFIDLFVNVLLSGRHHSRTASGVWQTVKKLKYLIKSLQFDGHSTNILPFDNFAMWSNSIFFWSFVASFLSHLPRFLNVSHPPPKIVHKLFVSMTTESSWESISSLFQNKRKQPSDCIRRAFLSSSVGLTLTYGKGKAKSGWRRKDCMTRCRRIWRWRKTGCTF